jgi:hypothetical protein
MMMGRNNKNHKIYQREVITITIMRREVKLLKSRGAALALVTTQ